MTSFYFWISSKKKGKRFDTWVIIKENTTYYNINKLVENTTYYSTNTKYV